MEKKVRYEVFWERAAKEDLKKIGNREIAETIESQAEKALSKNPFRNGKPLKDGWEGRWTYRIDFPDKDKSYRAIYEIIELTYRVEGKKVIIAVVKVGERKPGKTDDVYQGEHPRSVLTGQRITKPQARDFKRKVVGNRGRRK